ncbi:hypothetical protein BP6252_00003 [Coleophoma cylindrospora]|uniref:Amine oxidase n=1 Tax=Coleophoma cylindrospora TaxID=1849047 RepID=A0A3D8SP65_9HELO|nr:hypothetical protein BP6252_00003 [Coleophoma cylindrospora]
MTQTPTSKDGCVWRATTGLRKGLPSKAVHSSSANLHEEYDVIVIGAGFTGLTAARDLYPHAKTLLIDARDRIGGRTWTSNLDGQEFEMGGMWVHWWQTFMWGELVKYELHKNITTASGTTVPEKVYSRNKNVLEVNEEEGFDERLDQLIAKFFDIDGLSLRDIVDHPYDTFHKREIFQKYDKMTSQERIDALDIEDTDKIFLATFISNFGLTTADQIGFAEACKWFSLTGTTSMNIKDTMGLYKLGNGGMTSLANAIFDEYEGDRIFNSPVKRVTQTASCATVETEAGVAFKAKYVICTIPLNVLKDVEFSPPFSPLRAEACAVGHPGRGGKILYTITPPEPPFMSSSTLPTDLSFLFTTHENTAGDSGYLVSFVHTDSKIRDFSDADAVKAAFRAMVPETCKSEIKEYIYHDWRNDPYAQGTWCCFEANYSTRYLEELQSKHGERVIMASSDYADGWRGCIDGAIEQGIRSAMTVKKLIKF